MSEASKQNDGQQDEPKSVSNQQALSPLVKDWLFWLALAVGGFFLSLTLRFGFGVDQVICAYGAWIWKTYHLPPYVGVWDQNFIGIFIIHRIAIELFGRSMLGFRIYDFALQLVGLAMMFYITRRFAGSSVAALLASILYVIFYYSQGSWGTIERESFVFFFLLLALALSLALENSKWFRIILVGFICGFVFLIRPTYGLAWPIFGVLFLIEGIRERPRMIWGELFVFGLCCLAPSLVTILTYAHMGHLEDLYLATIWYNFNIYGSVAQPNLPLAARYLFVPKWIYTTNSLGLFAGLLGVLLQIVWWGKCRNQKLFITISALALASLASYIFQAKYFPYHLIPFWGFLTIFSGYGFGKIGTLLAGAKHHRVYPAIFYFMVIVFTVFEIPSSLLVYSVQDAFVSFEQGYIDDPAPTSFFRQLTADSYFAADYLKPKLARKDKIEFLGSNPLIPYLLPRQLPSRFCSPLNLLVMPRNGKATEMQKKWFQEYASAVIRVRPRFFIIQDPVGDLRNYNDNFAGFNLSITSYKTALQQIFPELQEFLNQNYHPDRKIGTIEIWELN